MLASPPRGAHILQIYDSDDFLSAAVAHFAAEGVKHGEAVLLTGTREHLAAIDRRLRSLGVDAASAQLVRNDLQAGVPQTTLEEVLSDARFTGVRWWGEITSTLYQRGQHQGGIAAEKAADEIAKKRGVTILCPYLGDKYDPRAYNETLLELCCLHSHVIPAEDYARHRQAVNRAITEVVGDIKGTLLQSLNSWRGLACDLPSSQAVLFWLRETLPEKFEAVLARARAYGAEDPELST
jgi:hypothetical protein